MIGLALIRRSLGDDGGDDAATDDLATTTSGSSRDNAAAGSSQNTSATGDDDTSVVDGDAEAVDIEVVRLNDIIPARRDRAVHQHPRADHVMVSSVPFMEIR